MKYSSGTTAKTQVRAAAAFILFSLLMSGFVMSLAQKTHATETMELSFGHNVSSFVLDNGMKVVVIPDHRTPVATHMVWYKVGAADEPEGKSGIAHFLEHLMFKGTEKFPGSTFSDVVSRIGGSENAFTSQDYTAYFQRVAKEHLATVMEMEADRMSGLRLVDEVVLPERDVVLEERRSRIENDPSAQLGEKMDREIYPNHPYGIPIIGWRDEIAALGKEDAIDFYNRFYTPANAILIVAGDVTPEELRTLAEKTYGKVKERAVVAKRARPQEQPRTAQGRVELVSAQVGLESFRLSFPVPSYSTAEPGEGAVLDVLADVLGGGATSVLYQELVVRQGIAANVGAFYQGSAYDPSRFMIYASPTPNVTLEQLEAAILAVIETFKAAAPDAADVERTKTSLIAEAVYAQDNQATLARIYGVALTTGQTIEEVQAWPSEVQAVTPEAVVEAARRHLDVSQSVAGFLRKAASDAQPAQTGREG